MPFAKKLGSKRKDAKTGSGKRGRPAGGKNKRKSKKSWATYIRRSLKAVKPGMTIAVKTVKIVDSFINDMFERIATEAAHLARVNKKQTLGSREIQTAVRLTLPKELSKHAIAEGTKAVAKVQ